MLGDANSNGIVSLKDATAIQKYLAGLITFNSTQKVAADVDNSGSINLKDVTVIQKYLAKMIMSLSK
ncbi:MAG: dockerin type I repeat-containing protein [Bacillota bacterium]|nr:dockerin type I repeat-containing protein [Bacillota bacterium]